MLKNFKRLIKLILVILIVAFLHYNLPDRDIVRVVGTEVTRVDKKDGTFGRGEPDAGTNRMETIDVRYISTIRPNGKPMVYRNQDTGWGWPPYFKFDTGDMMATAHDLAKRNEDSEVWVAVKHYGWRIRLFSLYPNAVDIKEVDGPNVRLIPWFNIAFISMLLAIWLFIWLRIRRFKKNRIDPVTDKIEEAADAVGDDINETRSAMGRFFRKWFGTTKDS